jgi:hypothetical protein
MFVEKNPDSWDDWTWVSNKHLKAYMVFPAVEKIYGPYKPMQQHMCVLLQDPDLRSGPVGRALALWYERCVIMAFDNYEEVSLRAQQKYENHLQQQDRYKLELIHDAGDYKAPVVSDNSFYHAAEHMLARNGSMWTADDIRRLVAEIETFDTTPCQELKCSAFPLYVLRFGNPKASPNDDEGQGLAELSIVGAIFDLSAKIFSKFISKPTMTRGSRQKPKQQKKQKKQMQQPPKQKKQRSRGANSSDQSMVRNSDPGQSQMGDAVRTGKIEKTELIQLVNGSVGFTVVKIPLNPGLPTSFPVGSPEAKNWTEWKCKYLTVQYIPMVSEFAAQGQKGECALAVDYNAVNALPTAMNQIEAMGFSGGGIPSRGFKYTAAVRHMNKSDPKNVRSGPVPAGDDLRKYDGGNLYFAVSGCTDASQIGKLEVKYCFEMSLPTLLNVLPANDPDVAFFQSTAPEVNAATNVPKTLLLATTSFNGLNAVNTAGSIVPPAGNYVITMNSSTFLTGATWTGLNVQIQKNGAAASLTSSFAGFATGTYNTYPISQTVFVTCNGTDAISVVATVTYSAGAPTTAASLVFELS